MPVGKARIHQRGDTPRQQVWQANKEETMKMAVAAVEGMEYGEKGG